MHFSEKFTGFKILAGSETKSLVKLIEANKLFRLLKIFNFEFLRLKTFIDLI